MTPETPITPETISGPAGHYSGNSGRYIIPELLESPKPVRVWLTSDQCCQLTATGHKFGIIHPTSYPSSEFPGRHCIEVVPVDYSLAVQILDVIEGRARISKIKPKTPKL